jgi:hypothetical protein
MGAKMEKKYGSSTLLETGFGCRATGPPAAIASCCTPRSCTPRDVIQCHLAAKAPSPCATLTAAA